MSDPCELCEDRGCYELAETYKEKYRKARSEARRFKRKYLELQHRVNKGEIINADNFENNLRASE